MATAEKRVNFDAISDCPLCFGRYLSIGRDFRGHFVGCETCKVKRRGPSQKSVVKMWNIWAKQETNPIIDFDG